MNKYFSNRGIFAICIILFATAIATFSTATRIFHADIPVFDECYEGKELALIDTPAPASAVYFLTDDEASYLRGANQIAHGETATDSIGAMISAVSTAPFDPAKAQSFPPYQIAYLLGKDAPQNRPLFTSYRSVVFPSLGAPILRMTGCNTLGLKYLRFEMLFFRILLMVAVGLLAYAISSQFKMIAGTIVTALVACDAQLNDASSVFMPDVPGVALFFLVLVGLIWLSRVGGIITALGVGVLAAITVLIKFDFLYIFPLVLLVSVLVATKSARRTYFYHVAVVFMAYVLVIGVYMQRNYALTGTWYVTSKDTINLYIGNSIDAPARNYRYGMSDADNLALLRIPTENAKELRAHGPEIAMRSFFRTQVLELFMSEPRRIFSMFRQKFWIFLNSGEVVHYPLLGKLSHAVSLLIMVFAVIISPFFLWLSNRREWIGAIIPVSFLASLTMVSLVFFEPRFMTHLFPLATAISTVSLLALLGHLKDRLTRLRSAI